VHLLGLREDVPTVTAALDVSVLSSTSEGFPNVVGEAMSCGVPCVVTDVGDCAWIVGDTGRVVPPHDSASLASAIDGVLALGPTQRAALGERARRRIANHFSLDAVVGQYEHVYETVWSEARSARERRRGRGTRAGDKVSAGCVRQPMRDTTEPD
jgi:glycosyltransferase involved in cell wall biosynthesis